MIWCIVNAKLPPLLLNPNLRYDSRPSWFCRNLWKRREKMCII